MKYCTIANQRASAVVMGCMRIADKPFAQVQEVIDVARSAGVNMFDLADIYGGGECEKVFGKAVLALGVKREDYILQTKCGIRKEYGKITRFDFSKDYILQSVEGCLQRLDTDYIDVLLLHRPDTLMEPDEVAEAFNALRQSGKVKAFGVSNCNAGQIALLKSAGIDVVANQMQCSVTHAPLIDAGFNVNMYKDESTVRGDTLEYCRLHGIPLQAWSPLQFGFIAGSFIGHKDFAPLNQELEKLAKHYAVSPATIALAWVLRHPAYKQVVTGTVNPKHMQELCMAGDLRLTHEEWYRLYFATGKTLP